MADNAEANPGVGGLVFATDDISDVHYPITKLAYGALNSLDIVGDSAGKRLPVKMADGLQAASFISNQISLSGAEAALSSAVARRFRIRSLISNTAIIYLGTTGVSASTGYPLWPGDSLEVQVSNLNVLHAIVASGTQVISYLGEV
jgi:hypothetical protein